MDKEFLKAFAEIVREQVVHKNKIEIDGIGSFQVEHQKQFQKQYDNGRVVMMPPEDKIRFTPER